MKRVFNRTLKPFSKVFRQRAELALAEDAGAGDVTTKAVVRKKIFAEAVLTSNSQGVLCGLPEAKHVLKGLRVKEKKKEGSALRKGDIVLVVSGDARLLLEKCRVALNFLQVLSGIATHASRFRKRFGARVCALRKTHPCLLFNEKRAVSVGGCLTHRLNLSDGILIKDNHIAAVALELSNGFSESAKRAAVRESIKRAVEFRLRKRLRVPIEIEVESKGQALEAARAFKEMRAPDAVLLDNMTPKQVKEISSALKKIAPSLLIEASGGIDEQNAGAFLAAGADVVSSSALLFGARPLDFSLSIKGFKTKKRKKGRG